MSQIRRRQFENKSGLIGANDYPDAFKVVFTENAGTSHAIMYGYSIVRYILDGVEVIPNSPVKSVTPTVSGDHVLYFWINGVERLENNVSIKYLRIPANPEYWNSTFLYSSWSMQRIDFLGTTPPSIGSNFGTRYGNYSMEIRIPIGTMSVYKAAFQNANYAMTIANVIETNDFTYNT